MQRYYLLVLLLCYNVSCISDKCVTYSFEDNEKVNFTNTFGICHGMASWDVREYSMSSLDSPHRDSKVFITPRTTLSCISSFTFSITGSAILELNVYMAPTAKSDQIKLLVFQSLPGANDATVGNAILSPKDINFVPGWQTMRLRLVGTGAREGYIALLGMASEKSVVLVDSFRYIASTFDIDSCIIYSHELSDVKIYSKTLTTIPISTGEPSTTKNLTTTSIRTTRTTKVPSTRPVITTTVKSSTTRIPSKSTTARTTTRVTTPVTTRRTTKRPRLSVPLLLRKIKKILR
ncbi:jg662 [Pararge aegeria aegeria]|uniref:Jg662 protein n=1 Tax=Pararge aegeria aegeria TaxID=348720 RepID=A0A8S4QPN8_9NEOP|nr:jg662 [Pararge aegeria aegeria]